MTIKNTFLVADLTHGVSSFSDSINAIEWATDDAEALEFLEPARFYKELADTEYTIISCFGPEDSELLSKIEKEYKITKR